MQPLRHRKRAIAGAPSSQTVFHLLYVSHGAPWPPRARQQPSSTRWIGPVLSQFMLVEGPPAGAAPPLGDPVMILS